MAKLVWLLVLALLAWRLILGFWPWAHWHPMRNRAALARACARARALLGVNRNAAPADIIDAHRRLVARIHPDRGGLAEQVHEADAARDLLLAQLRNQRKEH